MPHCILKNTITGQFIVAFLLQELHELLPVLTAMGHMKQMI